MPYVENGTIILIGATTENPSFELNNALLSRCKVLVFKQLDNDAMLKLIEKAEKILDKKLPVDDKQKELIISMSNGDGRFLLNICESLFNIDSRDNLTMKNYII